MSVIKIGDTAPDFTLRESGGAQFNLAQKLASLNHQNGTLCGVLLVFLPHAFSPVCGSEIAELAELSQQPECSGTAVCAISTDSIFALARWRKDLNLPAECPLIFLSDFWQHGAVSELYGAFNPERGAATRKSFLINSCREIAAIIESEPATPRPLAAYTAALKQLS